MIKINKVISLYCGLGTSDKTYKITILEVEPDRFQVEVEHGPRGKKQTRYRKPSVPTTLGWTVDFYEEMLHKKLRKGYVEHY